MELLHLRRFGIALRPKCLSEKAFLAVVNVHIYVMRHSKILGVI